MYINFWYPIARSAEVENASPSAVSVMVRAARLNSVTPSRASSRPISLLTAEGVIVRLRAAAEKPPSSTARTKTSISPKRFIVVRLPGNV